MRDASGFVRIIMAVDDIALVKSGANGITDRQFDLLFAPRRLADGAPSGDNVQINRRWTMRRDAPLGRDRDRRGARRYFRSNLFDRDSVPAGGKVFPAQHRDIAGRHRRGNFQETARVAAMEGT